MRKSIAIVGAAGIAVSVFTSVLAQRVIVDNRSLFEQIEGKSSKEKTKIISQEIVRINPIGEYDKGNLHVEIQEVEEIDGGIEVTARAWRNGQPVGFVDGTVEIERFRFYNPRIAVPDPNGDREVKMRKRLGVEEFNILHFREDAAQATRESLADAIRIVGLDGQNIIPGKVGHTTSTFYPDPDTESTSVDGYAYATNVSWDGAHDATSGLADDSASTNYVETARAYTILRSFNLFDSSAIPDTDTISSATHSIYVSVLHVDDDDGDDWVNVFQSSPASNTAIVGGDYDQCGTVDTPTEGATRIDLSSGITTSAYNDFTLNATGLTWIEKTGVTKLCFREGHDALDSAFTGAGGAYNQIDYSAAESGMTTFDPKLTVVHVAAASAPKKRPPTNIIMTLHYFFFPFAFAR